MLTHYQAHLQEVTDYDFSKRTGEGGTLAPEWKADRQAGATPESKGEENVVIEGVSK